MFSACPAAQEVEKNNNWYCFNPQFLVPTSQTLKPGQRLSTKNNSERKNPFTVCMRRAGWQVGQTQDFHPVSLCLCPVKNQLSCHLTHAT